jgi:hypothetical protein
MRTPKPINTTTPTMAIAISAFSALLLATVFMAGVFRHADSALFTKVLAHKLYCVI